MYVCRVEGYNTLDGGRKECVGWRKYVWHGGCGDQSREEWRWWWVRDTCGGGVHRMFGDGECMKLYRGVGWRCMGYVRLRCVAGAVWKCGGGGRKMRVGDVCVEKVWLSVRGGVWDGRMSGDGKVGEICGIEDVGTNQGKSGGGGG